MKMSDILRKLADIADRDADPGRPDDRIQNPAELGPVPGGMHVDTPDNADAGADDEVMVPPLQLKLELLKRAVGVDNIYDYCANLQKHGITINRPPRDGRMAFIRTPDGISIELLQKGDALPIAEPWASMQNTGTW